jgi:putative RNA 2'-phosphotransferase
LNQHLVKISKYLSFILRHHPEREGLVMDREGWIDVHDLLQAPWSLQYGLTMNILEQVVEENNKQRFEFSDNKARIRARQGHSVMVDLGLIRTCPPDTLYHGTSARFLASIRIEGLQKLRRHHVHLSATSQAAMEVGARHGSPVILEIRAGEMHRTGHEFFLSNNGVWLTDTVPAEYINFPDHKD